MPPPVASPSHARPIPGRPAHLRPRNIVLVMVGGMCGTLLRALVGQALPTTGRGFPWATLAVNLVGAAVLPALLEMLGRLRRRHVAWRLLLGTGVLGGFTTYSAFSVESVRLLQSGQELLGLVYVAVTVTGGLLLGTASLALATEKGRKA